MKSKLVAITGGIGSGKSEVVRYLQSLGYFTVDCDALAKEISTYPNVISQVGELLGCRYVRGGQLDRKAIREVLFGDEELLRQYDAVFFGEVRRLLAERICKHEADLDNSVTGATNLPCVFVEIPVFDAFNFPWNGVWLVEASDEIRLERVTTRDGVSKASAQNIMRRQRSCADYTVKLINNGSVDNLKKQVDEALKRL